MIETTVPIRDVVRVIEMPGVRGALHLVHVLSCGCWVIKGKRPRKRMACISCSLRPETVGATRVVDIAWQAYQAGAIGEGANLLDPGLIDALNRKFVAWWAKR